MDTATLLIGVGSPQASHAAAAVAFNEYTVCVLASKIDPTVTNVETEPRPEEAVEPNPRATTETPSKAIHDALK